MVDDDRDRDSDSTSASGALARWRAGVLACWRAGALARDADGQRATAVVTRRPALRFAGDHPPAAAEFARLHPASHDACFIANSVKTELRCEAVLLPA